MNFDWGMISDILTVVGIIFIALWYVFSASSNVNKSTLLGTKEKRVKLLVVMIMIFIIFGAIIANKCTLKFDFNYLVAKVGLVILILLILINVYKIKNINLTKWKTFFVEILLLVFLPIVEGLFAFSLIEELINKVTYDVVLLFLADIVSAVLVIGILYFRVSEQHEFFKFYFVDGFSLSFPKANDVKNETMIGQILSESDSFYDINVLTVNGDKIEKQEQTCINKSNIGHFSLMDGSTFKWALEKQNKKKKQR